MSISNVDTSRAYYDINSLQSIKTQNQGESLEQAAQLFETQFLKMVLKNMRQASDAVAAEDSPFNSKTQQFYREMYDSQLAQQLASTGHMGLSQMLVKQFTGPSDVLSLDEMKAQAENVMPLLNTSTENAASNSQGDQKASAQAKIRALQMSSTNY